MTEQDYGLEFERDLSLEEGATLVALPGVEVEAVGRDSMLFGDGDILFNFYLSDGRCVQYEAIMESDYYGGSFTKIRWTLWKPTAETTAEPTPQTRWIPPRAMGELS